MKNESAKILQKMNAQNHTYETPVSVVSRLYENFGSGRIVKGGYRKYAKSHTNKNKILKKTKKTRKTNRK
jgi:hypothetical protein